jgi:hypothetical protein
MWRSVRLFVSRHRRTIAVTAAAAAAAGLLYRARGVMLELEAERRQAKFRQSEEQRRGVYLDRARGECRAAIQNFLPTLRKRLFLVVDVNAPVRELKALRSSAQHHSRAHDSEADEGSGSVSAAEDPREAELWDSVKVLSFTRLLVGVYAFNTLNLMLRLQLHVLGRYSFEESKEVVSELGTGRAAAAAGGCPFFQRPGAISMEARHLILSSTYEYLLGDGLLALAADLQGVVERCMAEWHCQTKLEISRDQLLAMLTRIRVQAEGDLGHGSTMGVLGEDMRRYLVGPAGKACAAAVEGTSVQRQVQQVLDETWDAVESPLFGVAMKESLAATFSLLYHHIGESLYGPLGSTREEPKPPLATVVSMMKVRGWRPRPPGGPLLTFLGPYDKNRWCLPWF